MERNRGKQQNGRLDLFKKIGDIKGTFHARMDTIRDRNSKDLTEAKEIKKWQEYTEELHKKDLNDPDNPDVWSLTWSQVSWSVKSSESWEALL